MENSRAATGSSEARCDKRYRIRIPVILALGNKSIELRTGDVSLRGMFLRTDRGLHPGQFIRLDIDFPWSGTKLSLFASVAYCVAPPGTPDRPPGCGVQLYGNGAHELELWEKFIAEVEKRRPDSLTQDVELGATSTAPPEPIRRRFQRFDAELQVRGRFGDLDDLVLMYTRDISKGGMFIATTATVDVGNELDLQLVHPRSEQTFSLRCVVRRVVMERKVHGMGVEFLDLDERRRNQLWDFISSGVNGVPRDDAYLPLAADDIANALAAMPPDMSSTPVINTAPPPAKTQTITGAPPPWLKSSR